MYAEERQQEILQTVEHEGRVSVSALAQRFAVATETIRRDLDTLSSLGLLTRVHGGAIPSRSDEEPDLPTRLSTNTAAKRRIALAASAFLPSGTKPTVLVDAGSTTTELVPHLADRGLRIVTNALPVAEAALALGTVDIEILPGSVRGLTHAAVGVDTVRALSRIHPDVAFIGCNGMGPDGITTPDPDEAATKSAMVRAASRCIVVADSSKAGQRQLVTFAELGEIDVLVSDTSLSDAHVSLFEDNGIEVVRA
ncbi:DeoR/GlpR family DNA-binding transcription regulator [Actinomyces polynesiensis]|uniref:DeoR/GlpR family DNA-binding transcription regulator n=1 Tax=Actinomyces polynesiensis TaxID=1325934 RepID=UPI0005BB243F|nr:DeoR/GlpR family DNA-binding transcription regulator [Actinomyces polynesiensis]